MNDGNRVGQQIGEYRLMRLLGRSKFSEVYLGEHLYFKVPVAVKVLDSHVGREDAKKFLAQAYSLAHLTHPHIVRVFDHGLDGITPFLVMNYAPNGTLRQRHPKGTCVPLQTIVSYVKQIASGLQYVHNQNLIHRDIKPHNMLLGASNEVLLSDFGIAIKSQSLDAIRSNDFEGTVIYAAPEQLQGRPRRSSDQYALGVVVYEWLSGTWPFSGSFGEIAQQHMFVPPPRLYDKGVEISPGIEAVVLKALAKEAQQRFGSVQEFADALVWASQAGEHRVVASMFRTQVMPKRQFMSPFPFSVSEVEVV